MECPACGRQLQQMQTGGIVVDVCENGCGGIWFDNYELEKVDEQHEAAGESLLDLTRDPSVQVDHGQQRSCPKCVNQPMLRHFFSIKQEVEVDECPACGGLWLDYGELGQLRSQYEDEAERKQAAHNYFHEAFGADLEQMRLENEQKLQSSRKIARVFRFICPTYYVPGKQEWGAF